jgi:hypothetical protein
MNQFGLSPFCGLFLFFTGLSFATDDGSENDQ